MNITDRTIYWKGEISCSHRLTLPYESPCCNDHGHNYHVEVWLRGQMNANGMIIDYTEIKKVVMKYDHGNLNDYIRQPTAENISEKIARVLFDQSNVVDVRVRVAESDHTWAEFKITKE